jgi:hypothetical protein
MNAITELQKYHDEISERCDNLLEFIKSGDAKLIHEDDRHLISLEYGATSELLFIIARQIERGGDKPAENTEWADPSEFWKDEFVV